MKRVHAVSILPKVHPDHQVYPSLSNSKSLSLSLSDGSDLRICIDQPKVLIQKRLRRSITTVPRGSSDDEHLDGSE